MQLSQKKLDFANKRDLVYITLRDQIVLGHLKPSQRMSASEVAEQMGVSRTPVNTALRILEEQGFVTVLPNIGFEIKSYSWEEIEEMMSIRLALEQLAVTWSMERGFDQWADGLKRLSQKMRQTVIVRDKEAYYHANQDFHNTLYQSANAARLLELHNRIWDYEGWYSARMHESSSELLMLCDDHDELLILMERGDEPKAHSIVNTHVGHCLQLLKENISFMNG